MAKRTSKPLSWYIIWTVISMCVLAVLFGFILSLPVWQVEKVRAEGNKFIDSEKIINIAKIPLGNNIFMVDADEIKEKFSRIIQIKRIRVFRRLPGTMVIEVTERRPFAIAVIGSTTCLIDDEGYIIAKKNLYSSIYRSEITKFPVIRGISEKSLEKGVRLNKSDREFIASALGMLSKFVDIGTIQIESSNRSEILIYMEDVLKVKIGDTTGIEKKIRTVNAILKALSGKWEKVSYIDVRVPENPAVKFK